MAQKAAANPNLGKRGTDSATNFSGVITGYWEELGGASQYRLESLDQQGKPVSIWCESGRVTIQQ